MFFCVNFLNFRSCSLHAKLSSAESTSKFQSKSCLMFSSIEVITIIDNYWCYSFQLFQVHDIAPQLCVTTWLAISSKFLELMDAAGWVYSLFLTIADHLNLIFQLRADRIINLIGWYCDFEIDPNLFRQLASRAFSGVLHGHGQKYHW